MEERSGDNGDLVLTVMLTMLPSDKGTYLLLLRCTRTCSVTVGRIGRHGFDAGWYLYAGSARGPGGIAARAGRHLRQDKALRWHIDYLTTVMSVEEVWFRRADEREECRWAQAMARLPDSRVPVRGFGASDCRCATHLVGMQRAPRVSQFVSLIARDTGVTGCEELAIERTFVRAERLEPWH